MFPDLFSDYMYTSDFEDFLNSEDISDDFRKAVVKAVGLPPEAFGYRDDDLKDYEKEAYIE